jgi:signal transduction histidine kinase
VAVSVAQFTAAGLVAVLALAVGIGALAQRAGAREAVRSAEQVARVVASGVVAQLLTPGLVRGDPEAHAAMRSAVDVVLASGPVVRVKVWDTAGRVVWSDEPRLIGEVFPLDESARTAVAEQTVVSEISHLSAEENRFERGGGALLEVYVGVQDTTGRTLVVEVYQRYDAVEDGTRQAWLSFAPASLGALALLQAVQVPLAWRLSRRTRAHQQAEGELLQAAVQASEAERRRIARDVHDCVLQDLTGLAYDLDAARLGGADEDRVAVIGRTATGLRRCVAELRRLLADLSPPRPPEAGLGPALVSLAKTLTRENRQVTVRADDAADLPGPAAALLYRCAQEALRNVATHSGARHVAVTVRRDGDSATLVVEDDGRGFDEVELARLGATHLGLRALRDSLGEAGGLLGMDSAPGCGTRLEATVPLHPAGARTMVAR